MRPNHNDDPNINNLHFSAERFPVSSDRLNGRATEAITRQLDRLEDEIGRVDQARLPEDRNIPLYGYSIDVTDRTGTNQRINLPIDVDPVTHEPIGEDLEFFQRRNRAAVLRSRSRSKGDAGFNYDYRKNRGNGPGGHGYNTDPIEVEYHEALYDFIARKIAANRHLNSANLVTQAVSRTIVQEELQMGALEHMAAEQKSGNRFANFIRNHKKTRIALGLALTGIGIVGVATGQVEIAAPAFAARSALSAAGGYLLGRTAWDAVQGSRSRRAPDNDLRVTRDTLGDFSGSSPNRALNRFIKLTGAEARAASHNEHRAEFVRFLGRGLVQNFIAGELNFAASRSRNNIRAQVEQFYNDHIIELQQERLKSDQTQSRRRHVAGIAGAVALGALPAIKGLGIIGGFEIGSHASVGPHFASAHHVTVPKPKSALSTKTVESSGGKSTNVSNEINVTGNNDTVFIGGSSHGKAALSSIVYRPSFTQTDVLHVQPGGGFISTLESQYHLSAAQADHTYYSMYHNLYNSPGTYLYGSDIRISAPGNLDLSKAASSTFNHQLRLMHKLPDRPKIISFSRLKDTSFRSTSIPKSVDAHVTNKINISGNNDRVIVEVPNHTYSLDSSTRHLSALQVAEAHTFIEDFVKKGSTGLTQKAQNAITRYAEASIERPVGSSVVQNAKIGVSNLLKNAHYNISFLSMPEAEKLKLYLDTINSN